MSQTKGEVSYYGPVKENSLAKDEISSFGPRLTFISFEILPISQPFNLGCLPLTSLDNHKCKWSLLPLSYENILNQPQNTYSTTIAK